jgi:hypothetical protein
MIYSADAECDIFALRAKVSDTEQACTATKNELPEKAKNSIIFADIF